MIADLVILAPPPGRSGGRITALLDGEKVGSLEYASDGFVEGIGVRYKRQGIARAMWEAMPIAPIISHDGNTDEGACFLSAMTGDPLDAFEVSQDLWDLAP